MDVSENILQQMNTDFFKRLEDDGVASIDTGVIKRDEIIYCLGTLSERLGAVIPHTLTQDFTDITMNPKFNDRSVLRPQSDNGPQAPHVDGVLSNSVPTFLVMHCINPAAIGGESIYVDTRDILEFILHEKDLTFAPLFHPDAVVITRPQFGERQRPVFKIMSDIIETYFSDHEYNNVNISPQAKCAFDRISSFIKDARNQKVHKARPGELTVVVNKRVLHGRKSFKDLPSKRRHYVRAWYNADGVDIPPGAKGFRIDDRYYSKILDFADLGK